jgi:hypothetical protein
MLILSSGAREVVSVGAVLLGGEKASPRGPYCGARGAIGRTWDRLTGQEALESAQQVVSFSFFLFSNLKVQMDLNCRFESQTFKYPIES